VTVETLGEAWRAGWRVKARCAFGKRDGLKSIRECHRDYELDMETLVWTRGAAMPISDLSKRLRCPACRSLKVTVAFVPPPLKDEDRARSPALRDQADALPHVVQIIGPAGGVVKLVAASIDLAIARAAYEAAVTALTLDVGCFLALGHFGRTVARHPPAEPAPQVEPGAYNAEYARMREGLPKGRRREWK
jgi:hypothetical protein